MTAVKPTVMIVGPGSVGSVLLELLAREQAMGRIVLAGRDEAHLEARCNLARTGALAQGAAPDIGFERADLNDVDRTAELLARISPDLALCTASLQTWWLSEALPPAARLPLAKARFGAWLPVHLTLAVKFMEAARRCAFRGHTLIASFPDVVDVVLHRLGAPATCGIGNLDEIVPKLRGLAARRLNASPRDIRVQLVAHHALEPFVFGSPDREAPPFWVRVEHHGDDVTATVNAKRLLFEHYPLPAGPAWHFLTGGSAARLVRALTTEAGCMLHVPGPNGLPGGYPVVASRHGIALLDLPGLSREQAIAINEQSHPFDGIERIDADGSVHFTADASAAMREALGYEAGTLRPSESEARALELLARFEEYARRHGVDLGGIRRLARLMG